MTNEAMRQQLWELKAALYLDHTPIGIAFVKEAPPGVARPDVQAPSGCSFWRLAEWETLYTEPEDHYNCPIGVLTMGFQIPADRQSEAQELLKTMCDIEYISQDELGDIPGVDRGHRGIVYGPLSQLPVDPDVALFICRPSQAMLLAEAGGQFAWTGGGSSAFGRPSCAVIPMALRSGAASFSMGCIGARVYAALGDEEMIVAIPGAQLPSLLEKLQTILGANSTLEELHVGRRAQF